MITPHRVLIGGAALVGATFVFSPLSVLFAGAMVAVLRAAVRGIGGRERRWLLGILIAAVALRVILLLALYVTTDPQRENFRALFGDDRFSTERAQWILHVTDGVDVGPYWRQTFNAEYGSLAFDRFLAIIQSAVGPAPHALPLLSVAAFVGSCGLLYRAVRRRLGRAVAIGGLLLLAFWPTFVGWSTSILRESFVLLASSVALVAAVAILEAAGMRRRFALGVVVVAAVYVSGVVRVGSDYILAASICCGFVAALASRRPLLLSAIMAILISGTIMSARIPRIQSRVQGAVSHAVQVHLGQAIGGNSYVAADDRFYLCRTHWATPDCYAVSFEEGARFLFRAVALFVFLPLPSQVVNAGLAALLPEFLAWYVLILVAPLGVWVGWRRQPALVGACAGYCLTAVAAIAPHGGNIGTAIRHRDMMVPFIVWLGAVGAVALVKWVVDKGDAVSG